MATETKTFYPQRHKDFVGDGITNPDVPVGNGVSNTTYARISASTYAQGGISYCKWPFDVSAIPSEATIDSVTCKVKANLNVATNVSAAITLYSGSTLKGTDTPVIHTSATIYTVQSDPWTRSELSDISLETLIYTTSTTRKYLYFYGADLTVVYSVKSEKFMLKLSGSYHDIPRVFQKIDGIWVEQESLEGVVDTSKKLVNGGEIN